ncbi:MAG: transcriptional regulator NrdR [Proteobacteria bacterium]|nr:transcriptional regulator NrdR [Pseudomonadota bacterium]
MKCPFCGDLEDKVIDSRSSKDGYSIRRRRECISCKKRFTTHEKTEETLPSIIKKDERREPFDRDKILSGITKACQKRPISIETIEAAVDRIEREIQERGLKEIKSSELGERIMKELHDLDDVAYVRFASVYRSFKDISEFMAEVKALLGNKR